MNWLFETKRLEHWSSLCQHKKPTDFHSPSISIALWLYAWEASEYVIGQELTGPEITIEFAKGLVPLDDGNNGRWFKFLFLIGVRHRQPPSGTVSRRPGCQTSIYVLFSYFFHCRRTAKTSTKNWKKEKKCLPSLPSGQWDQALNVKRLVQVFC